MKNLLTLANITKKNEVLNALKVLKINMSNTQKLKKSNNLIKLKSFSNLFKSQNTNINIKALKFLIFKTKVAFI